MNAITSVPGGGHGALHLLTADGCNGFSEFLAPAAASSLGACNKRKRRPAGTPDPGAEVVVLSPKTLMESDRYVCEICNQGFQRDQNLQMHRRRHKVPWKLLKRPSLGTHKRVYVCPERSCLHHDPSHALGDLVGIKKHYRRKHCTEKQWKCDRCSKGYAVQSDYKAHLKTCGTRGHCCDCGRVFSRVESFIEHQDTCNAVKHESMQSGGGSERKISLNQHHRNSNESPSTQSSDTTQAMSFAQSGMSDTVARSTDSTLKVIADEHSRRTDFTSNQAYTSAMPAWLTERGLNELELLPASKQHAYSELLASRTAGTMQGSSIRRAVDQGPSHGSRSQVTRCASSINSVPCPEVSYTESKLLNPPSVTLSGDDVNTPSLQLSIGPYGTEAASRTPSCVDTKPSFSSVEREVLALTYQQSRQLAPVGIPRNIIENPSRPGTLGNDLALSIPATSLAQSRNQAMEAGAGPGTDAVRLGDFLFQAARRLGPSGQEQSHAEFNQSKKHDSGANLTEMVANYNPCAGSTSSYHEDRAVKIHESDPALGMRGSRNGPSQYPQLGASQLEPAMSMITSRQGAALEQMDAAETEHFAASVQSMDHAGARVEASLQAREQARTEMNTAWSDLAAARRSKDQARQESEEAQRELARAERLKREAREQIQSASAERVYADRAREVAKRQIEISEAELSQAKRLREHAQAELEKAQFFMRTSSASSHEQQQLNTYCHSCKSAIEIPPRRSSHLQAGPGSSSTWSFMTPAPASTTSMDPLQGAGISGSGQVFMVPGGGSGIHELGAGKQVDFQAMQDPNTVVYNPGRISWSETVSDRRGVQPGMMSSGEGSTSLHLWPGNTIHNLSYAFATSIATEESPRSGSSNPHLAVLGESNSSGGPVVTAQMSADRDHTKRAKNLDLN